MLKITSAGTLALLLCLLCLFSCRHGSEDKQYTIGFSQCTGGDAWRSVVTDFARLNYFQVPSYGPVDHPDSATLIAYVERVREARGLGVLQFHGTGGDYLDVSAQAHQALIDHLRKRPDLWVATFQEVMDYVTSRTR